MLGANTRIGIGRATKGTNGQSVYAAPHKTVPSYKEPASEGLSLAQGAPIGQMWHFFTDPLAVPTVVQIGDLLSEASGQRYIVSGIEPFENHLKLVATSYTTPLSS